MIDLQIVSQIIQTTSGTLEMYADRSLIQIEDGKISENDIIRIWHDRIKPRLCGTTNMNPDKAYLNARAFGYEIPELKHDGTLIIDFKTTLPPAKHKISEYDDVAWGDDELDLVDAKPVEYHVKIVNGVEKRGRKKRNDAGKPRGKYKPRK